LVQREVSPRLLELTQELLRVQDLLVHHRKALHRVRRHLVARRWQEGRHCPDPVTCQVVRQNQPLLMAQDRQVPPAILRRVVSC
jgi:hypothetical protein